MKASGLMADICIELQSLKGVGESEGGKKGGGGGSAVHTSTSSTIK